tara:strand:- start:24 stop:914 length:891 start_codon:yes stop_codon:yes gene_type:complete
MNKENNYQKITIVIVLYKEEYNLIYKTLDKIRSFKKIIVDNANNLELKKKIQSEFFIDQYILNKKNNGFSAGYNQGVKLNNSEFSLVLGPDCIISENNINILFDSFLKEKNCFLVSPTAYNENSKLSYAGGPLPENGGKNKILDLKGNVCVESTLGACMLFRTKDFIDLGLFDENFFVYFSDDDLCRRIKLKKKSIIQIYDSKCIHSHGIVKIKNKYFKKFIRENNYIFDNLYYFYKIDKNHVSIKSFQKKIIPYLFKFILKILTFNFLGAVEIFSKVLGYLRFIYKIKWRDGRVV